MFKRYLRVNKKEASIHYLILPSTPSLNYNVILNTAPEAVYTGLSGAAQWERPASGTVLRIPFQGGCYE